MKIPTSPLLFTLALSSSTLAHPTPRNAKVSPNPEASPLLPNAHGTPDARAIAGDDGWDMMQREKIPGRFARRFGVKRQTANLNGLLGSASGLPGASGGGASGVAESAGGLLKDSSAALDGLGLGPVGSTVSGVTGNLLGPNGQNSGIGGLGAGLLGGSSGQGALGGLSSVASGLPVVGGLVGGAVNGNGLGGLVNGLPVVGGLVGGLLNGHVVGGLVNGLPVVGGVVSGTGNALNGLPVVGGVVEGALGQSTQRTPTNPVAGTGAARPLAQDATFNLGQGLPADTGTVPSLVANLGEGRYLLSSGQILSLGNLGPLSNLPGVGGLGSQVTGGLNGLASGGAGTAGGLLGQAQGALGSAQTTLGGLAGPTPQVDAGRCVNLGGQLVPLEQAQQILANAGVNGIGSYASDPAFDNGNSTSNSTEPLSEDDENHQTPAEAFQAADPNANSTGSDPDTADAETQSLLAADAGERWEPVNGNDSKANSDAESAGSPWDFDSRLDNAAQSVDNGYQNPYPEYRYAGNEDALDLIINAMGGTKLAPTGSTAPSPSLAPSDQPTGTTADGAITSNAYDLRAKEQKGWERPSFGGNTSRPPKASSTTPYASYPTQSASASAPAPTPTSGAEDGGFQDDGSWDEDDTWGDWVSAQPSSTGA